MCHELQARASTQHPGQPKPGGSCRKWAPAPVEAGATAQLGCSHLSLRHQAGQQRAHLLGQQGFLPHRQLGHNLPRDTPSQPRPPRDTSRNALLEEICGITVAPLPVRTHCTRAVPVAGRVGQDHGLDLWLTEL